VTHLVASGALIQSTFGSGNFETVVFLPPAGVDPYGTLKHYWLDTSRPDDWAEVYRRLSARMGAVGP
jgi:hypothetical protein